MFLHIPAHDLWWIVALLLIAGEVLVPGYFLLWIGIAAGLTGLLLLAMPMGLLGQALVFAALTFASCLTYWRWVRPRLNRPVDGEAGLNRRGQRMVGQRYVLAEPIVNGHGRARVGDSLWLAEGPDLPAGISVEVVAVDGNTLRVRAAPVPTA